MKHTRVKKLLFRYVFGALPAALHEQVEAHLRECEPCREEAALIKTAASGLKSAPVFNVSEDSFAGAKESVRRAAAARQQRPEPTPGSFIEKAKIFFPLRRLKIRLLLKPAFAMLMLLLLTFFIYLNSFTKPGQVFTFTLPFSLFHRAEIP